MKFRSVKTPINLVVIMYCALGIGLTAEKKEKKHSKYDPCSGEMSAQRIEASIRERIRKPEGKITQADYLRITYLPLAGLGLTDIAFLAKLKNLKNLNLGYNEISDLTPLAGLGELEKLHLGSNQITDLSPLGNLKKLKSVSLFRNQISDLGPIAHWTQAQHLALYCNPVSDLRPLHGLAKLDKVKLQGDPVSAEMLDAARKALPRCDFQWQATQHVFDQHSPFDRGPVERHLKLPENKIPRGNGPFSKIFRMNYPVEVPIRN
jgi:hypothetical protein